MPAPNKLTQLTNALDALDMTYEIIQHPPITSVQEGLDYLGIEARQGVSTIIFLADGKPIAIIRRDDRKLSFKKIKKLLHVKNLVLTSREQLQELTSCDIGYVSLYNPELTYILDQTILDQDYVYGGTGSPEHDVKIHPADLQLLTHAQSADISDEV